MGPISIGIVVATIFFFTVGLFAGQSSTPPNQTVGTNEKSDRCRDLCNQWDARRQERCNAEKDEQSARDKVRDLEIQLVILIATAAALTVLGFSALASVFTAPAAVGFFAAAAVAAIAADIVLGLLVSANSEVGDKAATAKHARDTEAEARLLMLATCSPEEGDRCLLRPSPC